MLLYEASVSRPYGRIIDVRIWEEVIMASFSYCPASCLEGLRKAMTNFSQENWCPDPDKESGALLLHQAPSVWCCVLCTLILDMHALI